MKSLCLTFLATALIFQGIAVSAAPASSPQGASPTDAAQASYNILLYSDSKNTQTWTQVKTGSCDTLVKPDGARLVKVYFATRVRCFYFDDAECKTADTKDPGQVLEQGVIDVPADATGSSRCELVQ